MLDLSFKAWCCRRHFQSFVPTYSHRCFWPYWYTITVLFCDKQVSCGFSFFLMGPIVTPILTIQRWSGRHLSVRRGKSVRVRARRAREHGPSRTRGHVASLCRRLAPPLPASPHQQRVTNALSRQSETSWSRQPTLVVVRSARRRPWDLCVHARDPPPQQNAQLYSTPCVHRVGRTCYCPYSYILYMHTCVPVAAFPHVPLLRSAHQSHYCLLSECIRASCAK